jgi:hypothetical protein
MGGGKKNKKTKPSSSTNNSDSKNSNDEKQGSASQPITIDSISIEFKTVMLDFLRDIDCSFPEYRETLSRYLGYSHEMKPMPDELYIELYSYCKMIYPARFFDILYKNEELFKADKGGDPETVGKSTVMFLPNVDFREIWLTEDITENTKEIIWKYLQLILFSIVNNLSDMGSFGDTAKLFEAIDEGELKSKLEEVIGSMSSFFDGGAGAGGAGGEGISGEASSNAPNFEDSFKKASEFMNSFMPNAGMESGTGESASASSTHQQTSQGPPVPDANAIHEHLSSILNGKIGKLAKEIAEETAADLDLNMENETSMKGVFQQLLKNPTKLSGIIKSVGNKLDTKLKSGELKESEIMLEASELMNKMKNMPGMNNIASMLSKMGMNMPGGGGGGGGKVNFGAMQAQLQKNMKQAQMRERLMKKVQEKNSSAGTNPTTSVFRTGEKCEKTPRFPVNQSSPSHGGAAGAGADAAAAAAEARMLAADNQSKSTKKDKPKDKQE